MHMEIKLNRYTYIKHIQKLLCTFLVTHIYEYIFACTRIYAHMCLDIHILAHLY